MKTRIFIILSLLAISIDYAYGDTLDQKIQQEMARQNVPGLTLAIVNHGKIARLSAYGYADLEWHAKTTNNTRFEIASISKMFTGAAARILIEQGKLDPDDVVSKYLDNTPESWKTLKVRHLLTMSTGLDEDWGSDLIPYNADVTTPTNNVDMSKMFFQMKPVAPIGTEFHYSSPGYAMVGMIVEKVSGQPLSQFVTEQIFKPSGMTQSSFIDNFAIIPERAQGYRRSNDQILKGWYLGQYLHSRPDVGVLTTAHDLGLWIIALQQHKIIKDLDQLWEPTVSDSGRPLDYNYGWFLDTLLGHRRVSHAGGYRTGFHTFIARYPDDDLSVIVLSNCDFSDIRNYALFATEEFIKGLPDPESTKADDNPTETTAVIAAVHSLAEGKIDSAVMNSDALEPLGITEVAEFLKSVESITFASRGQLHDPGLHIHGHNLRDYIILKLHVEKSDYFLTLYRDDAGKIAYIEQTT
jgi:CubicO group peptidase (beta-lactamase class C family)